MNEDSKTLERLERFKWMTLFIGIIAAIAWVVGLFSDTSPMHQQAWISYIFAFVFWGSVTIGAFGMMLLNGSLKGSWGIPIIRIFEAAGGPGMLLFLFLMFIPVALPGGGLHALYAWSIPDVVAKDPILQSKAWYLSVNGFWIRAIIVIAVWVLWSYFLKSSTKRQDETLDANEWNYRSNWGTPGLVMFFITVMLVSTDWVMSLEPHYFSTIYGLLFAIGCALSAMSLAVLIVLYNSDNPPYRFLVTPKLTKDFGNLQFTLTMLWAYMTLSQFLITWQGNLPMEAQYYVNRTGGNILTGHGDWNILSTVLLTFQFFVPFFVLLAPRAKRVVRNLIAVSLIIFITRIVNVYWLIFPDVRQHGFIESLSHWTDYAAFIGIGGIWFGLFLSGLTKGNLVPKYDTRLPEDEHEHTLELEHA